MQKEDAINGVLWFGQNEQGLEPKAPRIGIKGQPTRSFGTVITSFEFSVPTTGTVVIAVTNVAAVAVISASRLHQPNVRLKVMQVSVHPRQDPIDMIGVTVHMSTTPAIHRFFLDAIYQGPDVVQRAIQITKVLLQMVQ